LYFGKNFRIYFLIYFTWNTKDNTAMPKKEKSKRPKQKRKPSEWQKFLSKEKSKKFLKKAQEGLEGKERKKAFGKAIKDLSKKYQKSKKG
jgi:FKBP-type peptidyl-prolyl cis-trans isomerase